MILGFIGDIGGGKTLSMIKYAYEKYKKGCTIYTNLFLTFPKIKGCGKVIPLDMKFFKNYADSKFKLFNAVVLIDEVHIYFDSRNSGLTRNKIFSKFVTQSRKRGVDLVFTTQDKSPALFFQSGQCDLRLRKLVDYIIFCECIKTNTINKDKYIINTYCDRYGHPIKKSVFLGNGYYNLYDTYEIISFNDDEDD